MESQHPINPKNLGHTQPEEEIDLKEVFTTLARYKKSIAVIAVGVLLLSSLYAYFSTNVYQADLTLQIKEEAGAKIPGDLMAEALGGGGGNLDNEISIVQSRFVAQKALENLEIGTRYYTSKHLKTVELYKDSPFTVHAQSLSDRLVGVEFHLTPVDESHFRLTIAPTFGMKVSVFVRSLLGTVPEDEQLVTFSHSLFIWHEDHASFV